MEIVLLEQARRITREHRLIYTVSENSVYVYVFSLRFHYS